MTLTTFRHVGTKRKAGKMSESDNTSLQAEVANLPSSPRIHFNPNQHLLLQQQNSAGSVHDVIAESIERIIRESRSSSRRRDDEQDTEETSTTDQSGPVNVSTPQTAAQSSMTPAQQHDSFTSSTSQKPRSRSLFSSFFESKSDVAASDNNAASVNTITRIFKSTAIIVGETGSGKTTFKQCFTSSMLRTLPEVPASTSSSSSLFYYKSQNAKKDRLEVTVVDAGPLTLESGIPQMLFAEHCLYILTVNLTRVKQRGGTKRLLFGTTTGPSAIIHEQDKENIRRHVLAIAATCTSPSIVLVGTHRDQLSDSSKEAVDLVLSELLAVLTQAVEMKKASSSSSGLASSAFNMRILGCYAVSCVDHSCYAPNRTGPRTIQELWTLLCDLSLKHAMSRQVAVAAAAIATTASSVHFTKDGSSASVIAGGSFGQAQSSDSFLKTTFGSSSTTAVTANTLRAVDVTSRLQLFLHRAKTEMNFVLLSLHNIFQVAFNLGFHSRHHVLSVLKELDQAGELRLLNEQPRNVGARADSVILLPHLISRCAAVVAKYCQTCKFPESDRSKGLPFLDLDECDRADPLGGAALGQLTPKLLVALSKSIVNWRRAVVDRAETFTLIILLSDFAFQRKTVQLAGPSTSALISAPVEYVVPSLVALSAPISTLQQLLSSSIVMQPIGTDLVGRRLVLRRQLCVKGCPVSFFAQLVCRLAPLLGLGSSVFRDGVWLASDSGEEGHHGAVSAGEGGFGMSRTFRAGRIKRCRGFAIFGPRRLFAKNNASAPSDVLQTDSIMEVVLMFPTNDMQLEAVSLMKLVLGLATDLLNQKYPTCDAVVVNPNSHAAANNGGSDGVSGTPWTTVSSECASQMESLFFI